MCGVIATLKEGRITKIEPDQHNVHSHGHMCVKARAAVDVLYDPDRVLYPLKRTGGPGEFTRVTWDEALSDVAARLTAIRERHGNASFATFIGNPPGFGYATALWYAGFKSTLQTKWNYAVNAEDGASMLAASALLFGASTLALVPDFWNTDCAIIIGANPFVSHGSAFSEPRVREASSNGVAGWRWSIRDGRKRRVNSSMFPSGRAPTPIS
jgi:anaerobic selenocysteine-containing dehydrogenase